MIVGITGKIGTGKSSLLNILKEKGFEVISMDDIGHTILEEEKEEIKKKFLLPNKCDLRTELRKKVFNNEKELKKLNNILHPLMKKRLEKILKDKKRNRKILFVEAAVLFEMGIDEYMDKIVYLDAKNEVIVSRVRKRSNLSKAEIEKILKNQLEYKKVKDRVDFYIDTSDKTKEKVYEILAKKIKLEV
jgi:dephospho-CoA kinase